MVGTAFSRKILCGLFFATAIHFLSSPRMSAAQELSRFEGFGGAAAFSPDGRTILGAGRGGAHLWDVTSGQEIRQFSTHDVVAVAFSPDGRTVVTRSNFRKNHDIASKDFSRVTVLQLWDVHTGAELRQIVEPVNGARDMMRVVFSPDGSAMLTAGPDGVARLWDTSTGRQLKQFLGDPRGIFDAAFSPDGKEILAGGFGNAVFMWNAVTGAETRRFKIASDSQINSVYSVAFSPDSRTVLIGCVDGTARLWDATSGTELRRLIGHRDSVNSVEFSPDGKIVLTGDRDGTARLWDASTGQVLKKIDFPIVEVRGTQLGNHVSRAQFSPDGRTVLIGGSYQILALLWDVSSFTSIASTSHQPPTLTTLPPNNSPGVNAIDRRVALVVGESNYDAQVALPNPRRDAVAVATSLRGVGFQTVTIKNDMTRGQMIAALNDFSDQAANADWALVYFSGHGLELGGANYVVPVDAKLRADRDVQDEAVSLDRLLSATMGAKKLHIVILDACRDNPFIPRMRQTVATRSVGRGLARVEPEGATLVVYAARDGQIAYDGDGQNSPFVSSLVKRIAEPNVEINKLFRLVHDDVMVATGKRQEPYVYGALPGEDFFFLQK